MAQLRQADPRPDSLSAGEGFRAGSASGWGVGGDMVGWLCGLQNMALMTMDQPELLADLLAPIAA